MRERSLGGVHACARLSGSPPAYPAPWPRPSTDSNARRGSCLAAQLVACTLRVPPPAHRSVLLDEVAPPKEAPAMRGYLEEFMARPACVFQKPDVLRAVLGCLPFEDLQVGGWVCGAGVSTL